MDERPDHEVDKQAADTFVPVAPDAVRMCSGRCGELRPCTSFPTVTTETDARWVECRACRDERLRQSRQAQASTTVEIDHTGGVPASRPSKPGPATLTRSVPRRVVSMIERRWQGLTLEEVGAEFGLTRERVRQLLKQHGGPSSADIRQVRAEKARAAERDREEAISRTLRDALEKRGPMTLAEVVEVTGLDPSDVSKYWPENLAHLRLWGSGHAESRWTDEDICEALRHASIYEFPLSAAAYSELLRVGQVAGPSVPRIGQRFGSWTNACAAAGVVAGTPWNREYESKWSDEDLLQLARRYLLDPDAPSSAHRFNRWKRANAPDGPSAQTLRNRFGSWTEVKRRALAEGGWAT